MSSMDKTELFLNELESLLSRYFNTDWNYDFDFDKPITISIFNSFKFNFDKILKHFIVCSLSSEAPKKIITRCNFFFFVNFYKFSCRFVFRRQ